jgi:hypothetical protein
MRALQIAANTGSNHGFLVKFDLETNPVLRIAFG